MRLIYALAAVVLAATAPIAQAATVTFSGALAGTDPSFNRPNTGAPPVTTAIGTFFYDVVAFNVDVTGAYTMTMVAPSAFDTYLILYQNAFNPASPLTNALAANDDAIGLLSQLTSNLTSGVQYFAVVSSFNQSVSGAWALDVTGPGTALAGAPVVAPEPGTYALFGLGAAGLGAMSLRRRRRAAAAKA